MKEMKQVNPITARLRDILRNYSSAQLLNEMLQNADDAGSTSFRVLVDGRTGAFKTKTLLSPALAHTQGPALYQFDDAEFKPEDYESIQRVGDGTKMGDPTKTGQFGLGFNSVYHVTDTPMFITGRDFVIFDPHETHLPNQMPGMSEDVCSLAKRCPDQVAPFRGVFGCNVEKGWATPGKKGTLFRLPLRTPEAAMRSKVKDGKGGAPSYEDVMRTCVEPFLYHTNASAAEGENERELILQRRLLFLRFIEEIEIWVWPPGQKKMQLLASATLKSKDGAARTLLQRERTMLMSFVKERMGRASPPTTDEYGGPPGALRYFATMAAMDPNEIPRPLFALLVHVVEPGVKGVREEQWLVSHAFGDAEDVAYAAHPRQRTEKITLMPYCSIAALLASRAAGEDWEYGPPLLGRAYATLPLPITTGLPVHINGRWEISSDRNSLAPDDALPRHEWNVRLAGRVGASAFARLVRELAAGYELQIPLSAEQRGLVVNSLMPAAHLPGVFGGCASGMYERLLTAESAEPSQTFDWAAFYRHGCSSAADARIRVLHTLTHEWCTSDEALFIHSEGAVTSAAAATAELSGLLSSIGVRLTDAPPQVHAALDAAATRVQGHFKARAPRRLTPEAVRAWLRAPSGAAMLKAALARLGKTEQLKACRTLLGYLCADLQGGDRVLNPPEASRRYSTTQKGDAAGKGKARSCLDSPEAWIPPKQDKAQWALIDLGTVRQVTGVVLQANGASGKSSQHVTTARILTTLVEKLDGSPTNDSWTDHGELSTGVTQATGSTQCRVALPRGVGARWVGIAPVSWSRKIALRAGVLVAASGDELAGIESVGLADGTVAALQLEGDDQSDGQSGGRPLARLLDLESDPTSGSLVASCGAQLLPKHSNRFIEDAGADAASCARHLWPLREGLRLRAFSPADAVECRLPAEWKGEPHVTGWANVVDHAWLELLWQMIDRLAGFGGPSAGELLSRLDPWPLLPCGDKLVRLDRRSAVLHGRKVDGASATKAMAALQSVGLAVAEHGFELKALSGTLAPMTGAGILSALRQLEAERRQEGKELLWRTVDADGRAALLDLITRDVTSLGESELQLLAAMPLFRYEAAASPKDDPLGFTGCGALSADDSRRWTKPEFKSDAASKLPSTFANDDGTEARFLARVPQRAPRAALYGALKVVPMNRADFYLSCVLPPARWQPLPDKARHAQLLELQKHYETIKEDPVALPGGGSESFGDAFRKAPLFPALATATSSRQKPAQWLPVTELFDPSIAIHSTFFPDRLPAEALRTPECLQWLRRAGMRMALSRSAFLAAARRVHEAAQDAQAARRPVPHSALTEAEQVVSGVIGGYSVLSDDSQQQGEPSLRSFLEEMGSLRIARPFSLPPRVLIEQPTWASLAAGLPDGTSRELLQLCLEARAHVSTLVPFRGNLIPSKGSMAHLLHAATWSRTTLLDVGDVDNAPEALLVGLGAYPLPLIDQIVEHTKWLCQLPRELVRVWQDDRRELWAEGRAIGGRVGSFKQQLEMGCYPRLAAIEPSELKKRVADAPIVLLDTAYGVRDFCFIRPSQLFIDLYRSATPYAYELREVEIAFTRMKLHSLLDCPRTPTLTQLFSWVGSLDQQTRGHALSRQQLATANELAFLAALKVYSATSSVDQPQPFLLPDRSGVLRKATELVIDDAPWLDGRIDKSAAGPLPTAHPDVPVQTAARLGARRLSSAVRELPDAPLSPASAIEVDALLYHGAADAVVGQVEQWNHNLRSRAFRVAVRRAAAHSARAAKHGALLTRQATGASVAHQMRVANSTRDSDDATKARIEQFGRTTIVCVAQIVSRFVVDGERGGDTIDVTQRTPTDGSIGSDSLAVESAEGTTIYLKLPTPTAGGGGAHRVTRQASGRMVMKKHLKRWKPCLATELDRLLGEGAVRDRMLLCELLDVDDISEMPQVMDDYRIPLPASFTPWIGMPYSGAEGTPRALSATGKAADVLAALKSLAGEKVLLPASLLPSELCESSVLAKGATMMVLGRLERVESGKAVVTITSDEETILISPESLSRLPTQEENMEDARRAAEQAELAAGQHQSAQAIEAAQDEARRAASVLVRQQTAAGALTPKRAEKEAKAEEAMNAKAAKTAEKEAAKAAKAAEKVAAKQAATEAKAAKAAEKAAEKAAGKKSPPSQPPASAAVPDGGGGESVDVDRIEYKASEGFVESELAAREALAQRERERRVKTAPKAEPKGMDKYLQASATIALEEPVKGQKVPVAKSIVQGAQAVVGTKTLPGFDLVRVGNFTEAADPDAVADIAFFHNRPSLADLYNEPKFHRQELVKQCCGALRDVSDRVFGFDAAKVTLFYERGAGSRFVRQKLLFNVWPVEKRRAEMKLADVRTDDFVYAYFYGLLVHKLAHFFDVVHGTRHDFYMTEYRANHYVQWCQLLLARGFEPAQVMKHHRELLVNVVD